MNISTARQTALLLLGSSALALLLVACAPRQDTNTPTPSTASRPITSYGPTDFADVLEAERLLSAYGNQAWPGWGDSLPPVLIRQSDSDFLIGHPAPPAGFDLVSDVTAVDRLVYQQRGHLVPVPAATTWNVAGIWTVAIPERLEFQRAIDEQMGPGVINLSLPNYVRALAHEAFHAYQFTRTDGQLPEFARAVDEQQALDRLSKLSSLDEQHLQEGQALRAGLTAPTREQARQAAEEFLRLRHLRQASQPADLIAFEQSVEWIEGSARYADTSLMQLIGQSSETDHAALTTYPNSGETWQQFLAGLSNPADSPDGFRGRYYLLGAGQAFLLDRLMPDWKQSVFTNPLPLEDLLSQAAGQQ